MICYLWSSSSNETADGDVSLGYICNHQERWMSERGYSNPCRTSLGKRRAGKGILRGIYHEIRSENLVSRMQSGWTEKGKKGASPEARRWREKGTIMWDSRRAAHAPGLRFHGVGRSCHISCHRSISVRGSASSNPERVRRWRYGWCVRRGRGRRRHLPEPRGRVRGRKPPTMTRNHSLWPVRFSHADAGDG